MTTQQELETIHQVSITPPAVIDSSTITAPNPENLPGHPVENKVSVQTVAAPANVDFSQVSTDEGVSNETLNRTARTLRDDINTKLTSFATAVSEALTDVGADMGTQVTEINAKVALLIAEVNTAFANVRAKNIQQNEDLSAEVNSRIGVLMTNINNLKAGIDNAQTKISALDDVYGTDAEFATRVAEVNSLLDTLRNTDLDVVGALDAVIDETNAMRRIQQKEIIISSANGVYNCILATEGFGEFAVAGDYTVTCGVMENDRVQAHISGKTATGFNITLKSQGTHFVPQPHDASVQSVTVSVAITHSKRNPMTLGVDVLQDSFVTSGSGTDSQTVGAGN